jgi:hypothetical protein
MTQPDSAPTGLHPNRIWPPDTTSDLLKTRKPSAWFQVDSRGVGPARWPGKQKTARRRGRAVLQKQINPVDCACTTQSAVAEEAAEGQCG